MFPQSLEVGKLTVGAIYSHMPSKKSICFLQYITDSQISFILSFLAFHLRQVQEKDFAGPFLTLSGEIWEIEQSKKHAQTTSRQSIPVGNLTAQADSFII